MTTNGKIKTSKFFTIQIDESTDVADIFNAINCYFKDMIIDWSNCGLLAIMPSLYQVRWISRNKALSRLFEIRYLSVIFLHRNKLNLTHQNISTIFSVSDKIKSMISFLYENKIRLSPEIIKIIIECLQDIQKYFFKPDNINYLILNLFEDFQVTNLSIKETVDRSFN